MSAIGAGLTPRNGPARFGNRGTLILAGLLAALILGGAALLASGNPPWHTPTLATAPQAGAPSPATLAASRGIGADQRAFWAAHSRSGLLAVNSRQRMRATFSTSGVHVAVPGGVVTLALNGVGRGNSLQSTPAVKPIAHANRVSYGRGGLVEWYANGPLGLEQGLTLRAAPAAQAGSSGALSFSFALGGAAAELQGGQLVFKSTAGAPILRYGGLIATDANGKVLPSHLQLAGSRLMIRIDDRGARYPVTIDPLMQTATLKGTDPAQGYTFGFRTAVSGSTLVVGDSGSYENTGADSGAGAVYVFTAPSSNWAQATQVATLTASSADPSSMLGWSVAISGTGSAQTIVAGAPDTSVGGQALAGAVYEYTEPPGGWKSMTQTAYLTAATPAQVAQLGYSVVLSGSTVLAGEPGVGTSTQNGIGAVLIFNEPGASWHDETESGALTPSDTNPDGLGFSLALSGPTLVAGAPGSGASQQGGAYVFTQPGSAWTSETQAAVLTIPSGGTSTGQLGYTVATDGTTIAADAPFQAVGSANLAGEVYVYSKSGSTWTGTTTPTAVLSAASPVANELFGLHIAVAPLGSPAVETIYAGTGDGNGVYSFAEPASGWKTASAPAIAGLQTASAFSLSLVGGVLFEGVDNSKYGVGPVPAAGQVNVFNAGGSSGPTGKPVNTGLPVISGTAKAGKSLSCSTGSWTQSPTSFAYGWGLSGTPIQGASKSTYKVAKIDEGLTLTCNVTASNSIGKSSPATSKGVKVPVPHVQKCPGATGKLDGTTLGLVKLGMTRKQARSKYKHSSNRGKKFEDFFCLTPIGVRVGYASPKLLDTLPKAKRAKFKDRVIWASTSSAFYTLKGIRAGATIKAASKKLKTGKPFHIGQNIWYLASNGSSTAVLKVRQGVVEEIGIGDKALTTGHKAQRNFLNSFS
jgi:FG-GAP repeat